ncbi:type VII secretion integral membrane protein EccD [Mycobacterium sp. 1274756.6]|uniref:type VII secretion integral membrane protein EccD n=1 Tax=Mycobacterium sp. 1274756.6 TaxID=1834076 RepID=UPI0007FC3235|nr:type VII secretion integral membrane protein EccD [Mycobacterium sp. 1274756.6]OBJ74001.1 type VII secretion integral membrane protein EccD [Mycobacterium sp. 1274756.6]
MREDDSGVCRVAVHAGGATVDVTLPTGVTVTELLPALTDLLGAEPQPGGYHLTRLAGAALDGAMTLAQQRIRDGAMLVLSSAPLPDPVFSRDDPVVALSARHRRWPYSASRCGGALAAGCLAAAGALSALHAAVTAGPPAGGRPALAAAAVSVTALGAAVLLHRRDRLAVITCGLTASGYAALAGFLAVPDGPGPGNVLLAAMAGAAVAAAARTLTGCGAITFTAVSWLGVLIAAVALAGLLIGAAPRALGAAAAVAALAVTGAAGRLALAVCGLTSADPAVGATPAGAARRAGGVLTALTAGAAVAGSLGAITVAAGPPWWPGVGFAALFAVLTLLRARDQGDPARTAVLLACGAGTAIAAALVAGRLIGDPGWICGASAVPVAAALAAGFGGPTWARAPGIRRTADLAEYLAAAALVPLAVWVTGCYRVLTELVSIR